MDVIIEFFGGPLDGKTMCGDTIDPIESSKVLWICRLVGAGLANAQKAERPSGNLMTFRYPVAPVAERAKAEGWSENQIKAMMPYHEYELWECIEVDGLAHLNVRYKRLSQ